MLNTSAAGRPYRALTCLILTWTICTCISSASGGHYVKATLDCLTPALLAQAAAALLYSITNGFRRPKKDTIEQHHAARRAWVLALGLLHLMSSILTLASFGLSGVSDTYIIRTLEPIVSCFILYILHGQERTVQELLLLTVVAIATAAVVLGGPQPNQEFAHSNELAPKQPSTAQPSGRHTSVALALVATILISCRSVASKTFAAMTGTAEYDNFLDASVPGLAAAALLQAALWALFGLHPLHGLQNSWSPAAPAALLICGLSQCAYNAASFKVLQQCSAVMHGLLNVLKRVFIIAGCAALFGSPLTGPQLLGVVVANAAAAMYAMQQATTSVYSNSKISHSTAPTSVHSNSNISNNTATTSLHSNSKISNSTVLEQLDTKSGGTGKCRSSWIGSAPNPSAAALSRLVHLVGATFIVSALFLAYVVAALQSGVVHQHGQQQQQQQQQQQLQSHQLLHLQLQQEWTTPFATGTLAAAGAGATADFLSTVVYGFSEASTKSSNALVQNALTRNNSTVVVSSDAAGSAAPAISEAVERFLVRDFGRIQCLTALHEASKASLAPFLINHTRGGIALYDVALHKNLGDAVLWAAAARLVPSFHESVKYVCAQSQFPGRGQEAQKAFPKCNIKAMLRAIGPEGVVFLAPGGNWGDLWWFVHSQRLQYLKEMAAEARNSSIPFQVVQLPQSLSFSHPAKAHQDEQVIHAMPKGMLTLFTRQQESLVYAQTHYPNTTVLPGPDLAFSLGPLMAGEAKFGVLFLMRQDKEAAGSEGPLAKTKPQAQKLKLEALNSVQTGVAQNSSTEGAGSRKGVVDRVGNGTGIGNVDAATVAAAEALERLQQLGLTYSIREWEYQHENYTKEVSTVALTQIAESRLQGAIDIISLGKVVVTNRLHAAVMANLVGRPLIWIDTQHKKISGVRSLAFSYSKSCTERNMHSVQATSFAEAVGIAAQWLQSTDFIWSTQQLQLPQLKRR